MPCQARLCKLLILIQIEHHCFALGCPFDFFRRYFEKSILGSSLRSSTFILQNGLRTSSCSFDAIFV